MPPGTKTHSWFFQPIFYIFCLGAVICGYAVDINGELVDSVIVEVGSMQHYNLLCRAASQSMGNIRIYVAREGKSCF